jgi:hypothetical protein
MVQGPRSRWVAALCSSSSRETVQRWVLLLAAASSLSAGQIELKQVGRHQSTSLIHLILMLPVFTIGG